MNSIEDLFYIPLAALLGLFFYFGSQILKDEKEISFDTENGEPEDKENPLHSISMDLQIDDQKVDLELNKLIGKKIEKVFYIKMNYPFYEFEKFDSIDFGIMLQFEGNQYLNWLFKEGSYDIERDKNIHTGYYLDFSNQIEIFKNNEFVFEVSKDKKWSSLIFSKVKNIEVERIDTEENQVCKNLILETTSNQKVGIFSTDEPDILENNTVEVNLDFDIDWITIVFDDELINNCN